MKTIAIAVIILLGLMGCAHVKIARTLQDGTVVTAEYTRWFSQNIDGFNLTTPEGYQLSFLHQKSDFQIALEAAGVKMKLGREE